jgi:aminoglycoside 6'-N-acetyltransferase
VPVGYHLLGLAPDNAGGIELFRGPDAGGGGLGPDAARAAASFLLDQRGWTEVTVDPVVDNLRAIRAFERAGFSSQSEKLNDETGKRVLRMIVRRDVGDVTPADP